jgi:hypothetical protein
MNNTTVTQQAKKTSLLSPAQGPLQRKPSRVHSMHQITVNTMKDEIKEHFWHH